MREVLDTAILVIFIISIFFVLGNIGALQDPLLVY